MFPTAAGAGALLDKWWGIVFTSALYVILMHLPAYNNAFLALWTAFGSANQLACLFGAHRRIRLAGK